MLEKTKATSCHKRRKVVSTGGHRCTLLVSYNSQYKKGKVGVRGGGGGAHAPGAPLVPAPMVAQCLYPRT